MQAGPGTDTLELLAVVTLVVATFRHRQVLARLLLAAGRRLHPPPPRPTGRPIELIAADARRLRLRYRHPPVGTRFAKYEGIRCAYDRVLAEACTTLGHPQLLTVVRPGDELDAERERVEDLLDQYGFGLQDAS